MTIHGKVVSGLGLGTKLGYPTANLDIDWLKLSFVRRCCTKLSFGRMRGVYAARATFDSATHDAAVIIGARQYRGRPLTEVLILDFHDDLYGKELAIEMLEKISDIERFDTEEELIQKIEHDIQLIRDNFA